MWGLVAVTSLHCSLYFLQSYLIIEKNWLRNSSRVGHWILVSLWTTTCIWIEEVFKMVSPFFLEQ